MDSLASGYVAPLLQPGEVVRWVGCLMQPLSFNVLGVPKLYAHYVAVGTDRRLLLTEAEAEFAMLLTSAALKPWLNRPVISWWFDELGEVEIGKVEGLSAGRAVQLHPFDRCGPLGGRSCRYDAFGSTPGFMAGPMEAQHYFQWLSEAVMQRTLPVDPAKQPYFASWLQGWPAQRARRLKDRGFRKQLKSILIATVVALGVLLYAFYHWETGQSCLRYGPSSQRSDEQSIKHWEQSLADLKSGKPPPACETRDKYFCMCIDAAVVTKETWLRTGRTPKESTGEFCYDQAGLELRLRESKDKAARTRELIAAGERHRAIAFGLVGLTVLGLGLTIGLTWPRRAVA
jgi:hypothetical protein